MKKIAASLLVLVLFTLVVRTSPLAAAVKAKQPNVLFLFTDDQRADTISALGNPHIKTPNLDALARRGMVFNNAYCLGSNSGAVCLPSRNMLLSGRAYFRFGRYASAEKPNFPRSMKQAGYVTYHHGKLGNTAREIHKQFDHTKYLADQKARTLGEPGKMVVDDAITFLEKKKDARPFFMYLAFSTPHDPRVAAKKYLDLYDRDKIPLPKNYLPLHPFDNGDMAIRDERLAPWPRTKAEVRKHLHDYYAVITGLDGHIGRLLQTLKDRGEYDNTIIIFSSDHGLAVGSHGLMGKQSLYEHSSKSPLIFAGPGIKPGKTDSFAYLLDLFPTVCDMVGAEIPAGLDGQSLKGIIHGSDKPVRDSVFTSYKGVMRSVRDERWKMIRYPHINKSQLFDLASDPHELHSLADDPAQAKRLGQLTALMQKWQKQLGDDAPLSSAQPRNSNFVPPKGPPPKRKPRKKKKQAK